MRSAIYFTIALKMCTTYSAHSALTMSAVCLRINITRAEIVWLHGAACMGREKGISL
jgi:Ni,Fe-hydrogenase I small subunit